MQELLPFYLNAVLTVKRILDNHRLKDFRQFLSGDSKIGLGFCGLISVVLSW